MKEDILKLKKELRDELQSNILPYWLENTIDTENGGYIGNVDYEGRRDVKANKGGILNARILWTFSSAYRHLKNPEYLETAKRACDYVTNFFIDKDYGGTYWELDYLGNPVETKKQIYALAFTIYGLTEYYMINPEQEVLDQAVALYRDIEKHSFDNERNGYFEAFSREWEMIEDMRLSEKDQNENKTMNTHLHILEAYTNLFRVWKDEGLKKQLRNLIILFMEKFINDQYRLNLFFDDDWNLKSDLISFGHDIECSWLLHEAAIVLGEMDLISRAEEYAVKIAENNRSGLAVDGGLYYEYFPSTGEWDRDRHWWPQAEAMVGYFNAWEISGDHKFLEIAIRNWEFIKACIIDKKNGEWHWSVNENCEPNEEGQKAGFWKCPYHNGRACMELLVRS